MLKFAPLFGDHCVLPLHKELRIFGEADGNQVQVALKHPRLGTVRKASARVRDGRFMALLPCWDLPSDGCELTACCGEECVTSTDVALGFVFLAGGQSNMELELQNADEGKELIRTHDLPKLRFFNVPKRAIRDEEAIQAENWSHWVCVTPGEAKDMSAIGYFFGRTLLEAYQQQNAIGIIDCYWGGTSITCWMDEEALNRTTEGKRYIDDWNKAAGDKSMAQFRQEWDAFQADMDVWNRKCSEIRAREPGIEWEKLVAEAGECPWNPPAGPGSPYRPGGLCETMLKRITPAALTGMLYYQGEEDAAKTTCYEQLLVQMVLRWRELFADMELPFVNMQLPMWISKGAEDDGSWARTRMAQKKAQQMIARSALCSIIDCGEFDNIHPTDKRTPGERLAYTWIRLDSGRRDGTDTPLFPEACGKHTDGNALIVHLNAPVVARDGEPDLFEIAGEEGVFHEAKAELVNAATIRLTAEGVENPCKARYAYKAFAKVHLFARSCNCWTPTDEPVYMKPIQIPLAPFELL